MDKEIKILLSQNQRANPPTVTEEMIEVLPLPVQLWLKNSGVLGHKRINTIYLRQSGKMRLKPDQKKWMKSEAEQYIVTHKPGFLWKVKMFMMPFIKITGRDIFMGGKSRMQIKIASLIPLVNKEGNKKTDQSTLQRYLMELMWYPTEAISEYIAWEAIDDYSARATITYNGTSGSVKFYFNEKGEVNKCSAMRYKDSGIDAPLLECIGEVKESKETDGLMIPTKVQISWVLEEGVFPWYKFKIYDVKFNF